MTCRTLLLDLVEGIIQKNTGHNRRRSEGSVIMSQEKNLSMSREEEDDDDESKYTDNGNGGVDSNIHLSIRSMAVQTSSTRNTDTNGNSSSADSGSEMVKLDRRQLRHSVSIIVDPVIEDVDDDDLTLGEHEPRTSRGSSLILLDDFVLGESSVHVLHQHDV